MNHPSKRLFILETRTLWIWTGVCFAFLGLQLIFFRYGFYVFLIWNLFLAWIPLWIAQYFYRFHAKRPTLLLWILALGWLIFLPNAPYIMTDFIYLKFSTRYSLLFDILMLGSFAFLGFFLGIYSLELMKKSLTHSWGEKYRWPFTIVVSFLSGFAIYLGRFLRWNSWDFITNPLSLLKNIGTVLSQPFHHPEMILTTILFALAMMGSSLLFERYVEYSDPVKS